MLSCQLRGGAIRPVQSEGTAIFGPLSATLEFEAVAPGEMRPPACGSSLPGSGF